LLIAGGRHQFSYCNLTKMLQFPLNYYLEIRRLSRMNVEVSQFIIVILSRGLRCQLWPKLPRGERDRVAPGLIGTNKTVDKRVYDKWKAYVGRKGNRIANNYIRVNSYCNVTQGDLKLMFSIPEVFTVKYTGYNLSVKTQPCGIRYITIYEGQSENKVTYFITIKYLHPVRCLFIYYYYYHHHHHHYLLYAGYLSIYS
jgi:hypothetical protein